jgi:hypothetical protein
MSQSNAYTSIGVILILVGVLFVALPFIQRYVNLDNVPWWVVWVYRRDGFTFATSPLLIAISIASVLLAYLRR